MSVVVTQRCHRLAHSLAELKVKVRSVLATELAGAVGLAVRDVLVVALVTRLVTPPGSTPSRPVPRSEGRWGDEDDFDCERERWNEPRGPWGEPDECADRDRTLVRYARDEPDEAEPAPAVSAATAVAAGVNVGRWWLAKNGTAGTAVGLGVLATGLGLVGGPVARAALAVLAAVPDVLLAEAALARTDPS